MNLNIHENCPDCIKKEVELNFDITGSISQTIRILTNETPEEFLTKIKNGSYLTTLEHTGNILDIDNNLRTVGKVVYQEVGDDTEYSEFE